MVRMRSPVQIWLSAPRRTTSIADVVFFALYAKRLLRNLCVGCPLRTPPERPSAFRRLRLLSSPPMPQKWRFVLRGCGLRSTHSSASVWFVSLGHHLHGRTWDVVFFASYAKRLLRNLCVGCHLRTPKKCKRFFGLASGPFPGDSSLAFGMTRREGVRGIALARQNARVLLKENKQFPSIEK